MEHFMVFRVNFILDGATNGQNYNIWRTACLNIIHERPLHFSCITVYRGFTFHYNLESFSFGKNTYKDSHMRSLMSSHNGILLQQHDVFAWREYYLHARMCPISHCLADVGTASCQWWRWSGNFEKFSKCFISFFSNSFNIWFSGLLKYNVHGREIRSVSYLNASIMLQLTKKLNIL